MKNIIIIIFFFAINHAYSQSRINEKVNFETIIDLEKNATKDGAYINGYIINISYADLVKLDGKKVKITGKVTIVKGLGEIPLEYNSKGEAILFQGRNETTKHILKPKIKIVNQK